MGKKKHQGFSLIELAILITVLSLALTAAMGWLKPAAREEAEKLRTTQERLKTLREAMHAFRVQHGRLPCPARHNITADDNLFGAENCTNTYGSNMHRGAVPIRALGLATDYAYDAWGRRLTYQVAGILCGFNANPQPVNCTSLTYRDENAPGAGNTWLTVFTVDRSNLGGGADPDNPAQWLQFSTQVAYIIVSHGVNGDGAWMPSGVQHPSAGLSNREAENADADTSFYASAYTAGFDDLAIFETKDQIENHTVDYEETRLTEADCRNVYQALGQMSKAEVDHMDATSFGAAGATPFGTGNQHRYLLDLLWHTQWMCLQYYPDHVATAELRCPGQDNAGGRQWFNTASPYASGAPDPDHINDFEDFPTLYYGECRCPTGTPTWNAGLGRCT